MYTLQIEYTNLWHSSTLAKSFCSERVIVITDSNLALLYQEKLAKYFLEYAIEAKFIIIAPGEVSKTREVKSKIEDKMFAFGVTRRDCILAFGGGVVTDLAGFVAATFKRGIAVVYVPTSLMAMVDAAIGGKTGINTDFGKNTLGAFSMPKAILIDTSLLITLPDLEYLSAISEIVKHALIYDRGYFDYIVNNLDAFFLREQDCLAYLIKRSQQIKLAVVSEDPSECGKREILNFGHTVAHAIELDNKYKISHGVAVFYGLQLESQLSYNLGFLSKSDLDNICLLFERINNKGKFQLNVSHSGILRALQYDKKNLRNQTRCVLLSSIGLVNMPFAHSIDQVYFDQLLQKLLPLQ